MLHRLYTLPLFFLTAALAAALAQAGPAEDAIRAGGVVLLMRHATAPGGGDPEQFKLDDCTTQRNLSDAGRDEARRIGAHLKKLGLKPGEVLTSQWCRCRETAQLAFGGGTDWPALNSFLRNRAGEAAQRDAVVQRVRSMKPAAAPLVLVTHQLIVTAVTGIFPESGEVVVLAPAAEGKNAGFKVIGSIKPSALQ
jgi:phosphohistidine phosphatase SixA